MDRVKIRAGRKQIGDEINGKKITGLGKIFTVYVPDEDACCYGLEPGRDYNLKMQYAYFN
jgi:hypothetical protein